MSVSSEKKIHFFWNRNFSWTFQNPDPMLWSSTNFPGLQTSSLDLISFLWLILHYFSFCLYRALCLLLPSSVRLWKRSDATCGTGKWILRFTASSQQEVRKLAPAFCLFATLSKDNDNQNSNFEKEGLTGEGEGVKYMDRTFNCPFGDLGQSRTL